jgi:hypothetical protein
MDGWMEEWVVLETSCVAQFRALKLVVDQFLKIFGRFTMLFVMPTYLICGISRHIKLFSGVLNED